jgi:hypothetical protein
VHRWYPITWLVTAGAFLAGCGGVSPTGPAVSTTPASERSVQHGATITVRGDYAPDERGPYRLNGRYRVSFVQRGAGVDFRREVPFTAHLEQAAAAGPGRRSPHFEEAGPAGAPTNTARGRFRLVVDFGDSPYEVVLTPARCVSSATRRPAPGRRCRAAPSRGRASTRG